MLESIRSMTLAIVNEFGADSVECVLLHGSAVFNPQVNPQDLDLIVILRKQNGSDCLRLGAIFEDFYQAITVPIQLHLIYLSELPRHANLFSINTCGCFFVPHLRQAQVIYGSNIFEGIEDPTRDNFLASLLQKVQQYTSELRNRLCHLVDLRAADLWQVKKRTFGVLKDLLMANGVLLQSYRQIAEETLRRFPEYDESERKFLTEVMQENHRLPQVQESSAFLQNCLRIYEKTYSLLRKQVSKELSIDFHEP